MRVFRINNFPKYIQNIHEFYEVYTRFGPTNNTWLGLPTKGLPSDLWIYQEIIDAQKPDIIIQTGTHYGANALYLAMVCALIDHGNVITIDRKKLDGFSHPRVTRIIGSTANPAVWGKILNLTKGKKVLVILNSAKTKDQLLKELETYSVLIPLNGYLIIEDTIIKEKKEAVDDFLSKNPSFQKDYLREKFLLTHNPGGFLKRVSWYNSKL